MAEKIIIRLASRAAEKMQWLVWSDSENEIIASGEIAGASSLETLAEHAKNRTLICLLPSVDVTIKTVEIQGSYNRQMKQALPYLLEEDLAVDVDGLHFTLIAKQANLIHVALCDKNRIKKWLGWLNDAGLNAVQFIPEALALPVPEKREEGEHWQAVQLGEQWLFRESDALAWSCDADLLEFVLQSKIASETPLKITSYSQPHECCLTDEQPLGEWIFENPTLPLALLSQGTTNNKINLLSGEFKVKKEPNKNLEVWRIPAIVVTLLFVVSMLNIYVSTQKAISQLAVTKTQVESIYQQAFPENSPLKYARIKKKVKTMLKGVGSNSANSGFLSMVNNVAPYFDPEKGLQIDSAKYSRKRGEVTILASGKDFQAFEKFAVSLPKSFILKQGALNNSKNRVSGQLTIRRK